MSMGWVGEGEVEMKREREKERKTESEGERPEGGSGDGRWQKGAGGVGIPRNVPEGKPEAYGDGNYRMLGEEDLHKSTYLSESAESSAATTAPGSIRNRSILVLGKQTDILPSQGVSSINIICRHTPHPKVPALFQHRNPRRCPSWLIQEYYRYDPPPLKPPCSSTAP